MGLVDSVPPEYYLSISTFIIISLQLKFPHISLKLSCFFSSFKSKFWASSWMFPCPLIHHLFYRERMWPITLIWCLMLLLYLFNNMTSIHTAKQPPLTYTITTEFWLDNFNNKLKLLKYILIIYLISIVSNLNWCLKKFGNESKIW